MFQSREDLNNALEVSFVKMKDDLEFHLIFSKKRIWCEVIFMFYLPPICREGGKRKISS